MDVVLALILIVAAIAAYFVPSFVAWRREAPNVGSIIVVNVLFGWSLIGWGVALAMACRTKYPTYNPYQNPNLPLPRVPDPYSPHGEGPGHVGYVQNDKYTF